MPALTVLLRFLRLEVTSGMLLFLMSLLAMICANSPAAFLYHALLEMPITFNMGSLSVSGSILFLINEGLMSIFFLVVGLELKREFLEGELSGWKRIALPGMAALGGMLVPGLIYVFFNVSSDIAFRGWAIPVATDIAFALGVLSLFSRRIPLGLKLFLMALAIFDDVGAIIIIALFYSHELSLLYLLFACLVLFLLWIVKDVIQSNHVWPYVVLGIVLWFCILHSGIHPSIAGVLLALMIPLRGRTGKQSSLLHAFETHLHPSVAYFILPAFAFANSGLFFGGLSWYSLLDPVVVGIVAGLFLGKQLGVFVTVWLMVKWQAAELPDHATWQQMYGVALLCGIGFTMSLFLGTLAFQAEQAMYLTHVRLGVLVGSVLSGLIGAVVLQTATLKKRKRRFPV